MKIKDLIDVRKLEYKWDVIEAIPEFAKLKECEQSTKWHGEGNAWEHTKKVCEEAIKLCKNNRWSDEPSWVTQILAAALFHDIGKGETTSFKKGDWHSYGHEVVSEKLTRCLLWDEDMFVREEICALVRWHMEPMFILNSKNYIEKIIYLSKNIPSWMMLLYLKTCDMNGSIQCNEEGKKNDFRKLDDINRIVSNLNCYYKGSSIPYTHNMTHKTRDNGKKDITVHLMIGLPGSGKSTSIKKLIEKCSHSYTVVSRDIARIELGFCKDGEKMVGTSEQEDMVSKKCDEMILEAASFGDVIFIDNTNLKRKYRDYYHTLLSGYNVTWIYHYVEADSIEKNIQRREGQIDANIIRNMVKNIEWPDASEYNAIFYEVN
jgi:putative nucleotidyltransferase with HDIG domain